LTFSVINSNARAIFRFFAVFILFIFVLLMKNILVTGGAGYIGSHTVVELSKSGYMPIIVDDFRNSKRFIIDRLHELTGLKIPCFSIDICDKNRLFQELAQINVDGIIHFAADKAVGESVHDPLKYYANNIHGLVNILSWAVEKSIKNFIFSSSCTVYGEPEQLKEVHEDMVCTRPTSPYGHTKMIGEQIVETVKKKHPSHNFLSLRYFNPIGAHPTGLIGELPLGRPNNLLPFLTQTAAGKLPQLTVFGNDYPTPDGTCIRDYIHVVDLASAHVKGINLLFKQQFGDVQYINIGMGKGYSVLEIIELFEKETSTKLNWIFGDRRPGDIAEIYANVNKASDLLGWTAKRSIQEAIRDAWNWELCTQ